MSRRFRTLLETDRRCYCRHAHEQRDRGQRRSAGLVMVVDQALSRQKPGDLDGRSSDEERCHSLSLNSAMIRQ